MQPQSAPPSETTLPTPTSQAPSTTQTTSKKAPTRFPMPTTPAPKYHANRTTLHRADSLRAKKWSVISAFYERCRSILTTWSDAEIGQAAAPAIEDLGILDAVQWYGGFEGTTTQLGHWVRHYLFETDPSSPEQTFSTTLAARFLALSENYALVSNPGAACIALVRFAAIEAFNDRALVYWTKAAKLEPPNA